MTPPSTAACWSFADGREWFKTEREQGLNIVSIDAVGGMVPLAVSLLYLPRTVRSLGWFYGAVFALSMLISTHFSYCDSNAVHVAPGTILVCVALWLPRARGRSLDVPASAIFTLAFIAGFPGSTRFQCNK
jgi:hypothetical protein